MARHIRLVSGMRRSLRLLVFLSSVLSLGLHSSLAYSANDQSPMESQAGFGIVLSSEVQDAIDNGIVISVRCDFAVRESLWLFDVSLKSKQHRFQILRHALSSRYIVRRDGYSTPRIFRSVSEAANYVAAQALKLLELYNEADNPYSMKLSLNKFDLPGPIRLNAFISDAWALDTGWVKWQSAN